MKTKRGWVPWGLGMLFLFTCLAEAGPSLPVTKPPVQSALLLTGPPIDAPALQGQWFMNGSGTETVRTNEFYDDAFGGLAGANAITGYVDNITFSGGTPGTPITAFSIQATIFNDMTVVGEWSAGSNSHGESLNIQESAYVGPMVDVKLVAEFAIADTNALPLIFQPPYRDRQPYIEAVGEDQWAWYCWNPAYHGSTTGSYIVPTWDFGTIPLGQSASRQLSFKVGGGGLLFGDTRYAAIVSSFAGTNDILMNRSLSLKVSTWIDEIALDAGAQHGEEPPLRLSDVSVFHNKFEEPFLDFGDAPDAPYPTLWANNGARHVVAPGVYMGALIDMEADGQPDATATGDDKAGLDDEDGVGFPGPLLVGLTATVQVAVSTSGYIHAWIDFDANGSWAEAGEQILNMVYLPGSGTHALTFLVPGTAAITNAFARFRFETAQNPLSYVGLAADGEVEDYEVAIQRQEEEPSLDFGDAWDSSLIAGGYPTLLIHNGARHAVVPGVFMGGAIDAEVDGQPTLNADGDDVNPPLGVDDEDGVTLPAILVAGASAQVQVVASTNGYLNAWIDWNSDGDWADLGEQAVTNTPLIPGINMLLLPVPLPPLIVAGGPHSRWRFTTYAPAMPSPVGAETDGEVEDYEVQLEVLDFGDAPDPGYPTMLASDGARHRIPSAYWLGATAPDADPDGWSSADAMGDDLSGADDEDGVTNAATLVCGSAGLFNIVASRGGVLNAWMDFNGDGDWTDPGEQIALNWLLPAGASALPFSVPTHAQVGPVLGRFRFGSATGTGITGLATDGEVEDHEFILYQNGPDTNSFLITNLVCTATNQMTFWWNGTNDVTYEAQYTIDLRSTDSPPWTAWGGYVTGAPFQQTDTHAADTAKFYRVVAPYSPPPP